MFPGVRLILKDLDGTTIQHAGAVMAREQAAARRACPQLPASFENAEVCTAELWQLVQAGGRGLVATDHGRPIAVMTAIVRDVHPVGRYARLPAEGLAVDPDLDDPTTVLATLYGQLAAWLVADGVTRHYLLHVAQPRLSEALANLGFGRHSGYGVQAVAARPGGSSVAVRVAGPADLETIARLASVEIRHRAQPPMFGPANHPSLDDLVDEHRALREQGAVHLIAAVDGRDVGLLTVESASASAAGRLCPSDQPYIGPTATVPDARRHGIGRALVDAALDWAHQNGHQWISVDFAAANPLSRPFWLGNGFRPTGYSLLRLIDPRHTADPSPG